jgi:hypothetical protein
MELEEVSGVVCFSLSLNGCIFSATQSWDTAMYVKLLNWEMDL